MSKLSIVVPFRDADGTRTRAKEWILARWAHYYPEAEIVEAPDDGIDPFNKCMAVNNAVAKSSGDIIAILDADSWVDEVHVRRALKMVESGVAAWAIPCRTSWRLRQEVSERIMALPPEAPWPLMKRMDAEQVGPVCGFLHIVTRKGLAQLGGMDERIRGWGGEDTTFTMAMDRVVGRHRKLNGYVYSLWHARPRDGNRSRIWVGQDKSTEAEKRELTGRYVRARTREAMLEVIRR